MFLVFEIPRQLTVLDTLEVVITLTKKGDSIRFILHDSPIISYRGTLVII